MRLHLSLLFASAVVATGTHLAAEDLVARGVDLAKVLGEELLRSHIPIASFPEAARKRLGQEADRIEKEDPESAAQLRRYVKHVPSRALVAVPDNVVDFHSSPGEKKSVQEAHSTVSDMTVLRSDGNGSILKQTRHCENGRCVENSSTEEAPALRAHRKRTSDQPVLQREFGVGLDEQQDTSDGAKSKSSVHTAINRLTDEMTRADRVFDDNFDDVVNNAFHSSAFDDLLSMHRWRPVTDFEPLEEETASKASSVSRSTETLVRDGKVYEVTTECKDGQCRTWKKVQ